MKKALENLVFSRALAEGVGFDLRCGAGRVAGKTSHWHGF